MAKSPAQILANQERSKQGIEIAIASSNAFLAALNIRQAFNACLMQGLIGWRCGILSPVCPFQEAIGIVRQGVTTLSTMAAGCADTATHDLPLESCSFLEILVNEPPFALELDGLGADRLLDGILGHALQGSWDEEKWTAGLDQLRKLNGTALASETYCTYRQLLVPSPETNLQASVEMALSFFDKRKGDGFFAAGEGTSGGGLYNSITVDYRLAAILKKIGYAFDSIHSWKW